jgi:hypothetical protein
VEVDAANALGTLVLARGSSHWESKSPAVPRVAIENAGISQVQFAERGDTWFVRMQVHGAQLMFAFDSANKLVNAESKRVVKQIWDQAQQPGFDFDKALLFVQSAKDQRDRSTELIRRKIEEVRAEILRADPEFGALYESLVLATKALSKDEFWRVHKSRVQKYILQLRMVRARQRSDFPCRMSSPTSRRRP